ncbi:hypothetical protein HOK021_41640 [Streptomyces hygroscopicus]|nr:hypothetical protein HOK021_41640 [Streptomyces hygroscopicus]
MGQWYFTRFDACGSLQLTYDVFDTRTKKKIGGATFTAKQEIILQAKSGAWKTDDSAKLDSAWGAAKGLRAAWRPSASADRPAVPAAPGAAHKP